MPSFDVVSELDWSEVENALNQAQKELSQRFDFRGTEASVERNEAGIVIRAASLERARAALEVLREKLIRRKVSLTHFDAEDPEPGPKGSSKILMKVVEGIDRDQARKIIELVKENKLKVQASIHEEVVRISGKKKDDLQTAMKLLRGAELGIELQFKNFRD